MPQVPYSGAQTVAPTTSAGNDYINVQANPAAFGGAVAQGLQNLGGGLEQASQHLAAIQTLHDNLAVDGAFNQFQDATTKTLHGDPNDPSKPGYMGLQGADALNARAGIVDQLEKTRQQIKTTLQNPAQQFAFEQQSRRLNMYSLSQIGDHADRQFGVYGVQTQQAAEKIKIDAITANPFDEGNFQHNLADLMDVAQKKAALAGASHEMIDAEQASVMKKAYAERAIAMAATSPGQASAFIKGNRTSFDPQQYLALSQHFQNLSDQQWSTSAAASIAGVTNDRISHAIINVESGNGRDTSTSPTGAVGIGQIQPATFKQYALPGEDINNPGDNLAVHRRIVDDLVAKSNGDPERVAVGYFSGPGNIAPPGSATAWLQNKKDPTGQTTSGYVQQFKAALAADGGPPASTNRMQALQDALENSPNEAAASQLMMKTQRLWAIQDKQQRDAQESIFNGFVSQLLKDPSKVDPDAIANDPTLTGEQKWRINQMVVASSKRDDKDSITYGPGFWDIYQRVNAPDGDSKKITDPTMLAGLAGPTGILTLAGVKELTNEIQGKRTPDGEAESAMKKQFLVNARNDISAKDKLYQGMADPVGETNMLRFMGNFFPAYEAARKSGTAPVDLLSPDGKAYLGKMITPYVRTTSQKLADWQAANDDLQIGAGAAAPKPAGTAAAPNLETVEGILTALHGGQIPRDQARALLLSKGYATEPKTAAPAAPAGPSVPVNE